MGALPRALAAVAAASLALTAGACAGSSQTSTRTTIVPVQPTGGPLPSDFYGVNVDSTLTLRAKDFARMERAGVRTLRMQFFWPSIQQSRRGPYSWAHIDFVVAEAATHGITVLPTLFGTPPFETGCDSRDCQVRLPIANTRQRRDWSAFVRAAAERYGPNGTLWTEASRLAYHPIPTWQIWNEPNNFNAQGKPRDTGEQYARLVELSHKAVTAVDPDAQVILAGMFGTPNATSNPQVTAWGFLRHVYAAGAGPDFDGVAMHPYAESVRGVRDQLSHLHRVIAADGEPNTPVYVTEFGWGSDRAHVKHFLVKSRAGQARRLAKTFNLLLKKRARWDIQGVDWFSWRDPPHGKGLCGFCYSAGLYTHDGRPKPSLRAYRRFTRAAGG